MLTVVVWGDGVMEGFEKGGSDANVFE